MMGIVDMSGVSVESVGKIGESRRERGSVYTRERGESLGRRERVSVYKRDRCDSLGKRVRGSVEMRDSRESLGKRGSESVGSRRGSAWVQDSEESVGKRSSGESVGKRSSGEFVDCESVDSRDRGDSLGKELDDAWGRASTRAPEVAAREAVRAQLLRKINMNEKDLKKLMKLLAEERNSSSNASELMYRFAHRCYGKSRESLKNTKTFVDITFGGFEKLYRLGPNRAFVDRITALLTPVSAAKPAKSRWKWQFGKYNVGKVLGKGGQATVYLGWDRKLKKEVAIKVFKPKFYEEAMMEKRILESLPDHRNVIKLLDSFGRCMWQGQETVVLVLELADRGEMIEYLMATRRFEPALARRLFRGVLSGLYHCHSQKTTVVHRDLKLDNMLLSTDPETGEINVKLSDFGYSRFLKDGELMDEMVGTEGYAATELLYGKKYGAEVDVFSLGVMLFVMLANQQPFSRADQYDPWFKYAQAGQWDRFWLLHSRGSQKYQFTDLEKDLIQKMIDPKPKTRYTLQQVFEHPWMSGKSLSATVATEELETRFAAMLIAKERRVSRGKCKIVRAANNESSEIEWTPEPE